MITKINPDSYQMLRVKDQNHDEIRALYTGMLEDIKDLIFDNWDYVILVEGYEGSAKSSFALNIASDLDPDVLLNIKDHVFYDINALNTKMWDTRNECFIIDEAISGFFSRESMSKTNKKFSKTLATVRERNHILIMVIPNKKWIDTIARDHRVKLVVSIKTKRVKHMVRRGYASIFTKNVSSVTGNAYTNWEYNMRFPDFPSKIKQAYLEHKEVETRRLGKGEETESDPIEDRNTKILKLSRIYSKNNKRKFNNQELGEVFDLSKRQIERILKGARDNEN